MWLLAYWLAFLFNAQTVVFLEGPQGAVWFWSLTGCIWVYLYANKRRRVTLVWSQGQTLSPVES